jgi:hypothetical protein
MVLACHPRYAGSIKQKGYGSCWPGIKLDLISKIINAYQARGPSMRLWVQTPVPWNKTKQKTTKQTNTCDITYLRHNYCTINEYFSHEEYDKLRSISPQKASFQWSPFPCGNWVGKGWSSMAVFVLQYVHNWMNGEFHDCHRFSNTQKSLILFNQIYQSLRSLMMSYPDKGLECLLFPTSRKE